MDGDGGLPALLGLDGKVAVVTGSGGGIGGATARLLARAGAKVYGADLPGRDAPPGVAALPCDVGRHESVRAAFEAIARDEEHLDVVVHAAGIVRDAVLWKMSDEDWSDVIRVNLDSAFWILREASPWMRRNRSGSIVLVSSINGERGKFGQANYTAAKAGLIGLGRTAARELGRAGVRVNLVAPGFIDTAMTASLPEDIKAKAIEETALGRAGRAEDVAAAILFLASDLSRHVTGQVLRVDGGQLTA